LAFLLDHLFTWFLFYLSLNRRGEIEAGASHGGWDEGAIKTKRGNSTGLKMRSDPRKVAVALVPEGFGANLSPGDALAGTGKRGSGSGRVHGGDAPGSGRRRRTGGPFLKRSSRMWSQKGNTGDVWMSGE
jgi:hypothetical protein